MVLFSLLKQPSHYDRWQKELIVGLVNLCLWLYPQIVASVMKLKRSNLVTMKLRLGFDARILITQLNYKHGQEEKERSMCFTHIPL